MATGLHITVNGRRHRVRATPDTPLLYVLRNELGLTAPKFGCGLEQCGACTVHLDGEAIRSCVIPVAVAAKAPVVTLEGLGEHHPVVEAFIAESAAQCGYCINGMVMQAAAFLKKNPHPTEGQIKRAMSRNLCRCGTHYRIVRAIQHAAKGVA